MRANTRLEVLVGSRLTQMGLTLALAEGCPGGLLAHRVTNVLGSSNYLLGGLVACADEAKEKLLGVRRATLLEHGPVSQEVALEMARGVRERFQADIGLSVTGITGPRGGTVEKPVGLTWIGLSTARGDRAESFVWDYDREGNKSASVDAALKMIVEHAESVERPTTG